MSIWLLFLLAIVMVVVGVLAWNGFWELMHYFDTDEKRLERINKGKM